MVNEYVFKNKIEKKNEAVTLINKESIVKYLVSIVNHFLYL